MKLKIYEIALYGMLGALMFGSKIIMDLLPNIHLIAVLIITFTLTFGIKALYPTYIFVFITGLFSGFATWWIPYLYIWLVPLLLTLAVKNHLPKNPLASALILQFICFFSGISYGTFYAPSQAILYGMNFDATISWIIAGLPFDLIHGISNFVCGALILPLVAILKKAIKLNKR